jgi:hypothetical protein
MSMKVLFKIGKIWKEPKIQSIWNWLNGNALAPFKLMYKKHSGIEKYLWYKSWLYKNNIQSSDFYKICLYLFVENR